MESVVYDGPQPSRSLEIGPGNVITINRGEPFEVPKELAEQLLEQRHFSAPKKSGTAKGKAAQTASAESGSQKGS